MIKLPSGINNLFYWAFAVKDQNMALKIRYFFLELACGIRLTSCYHEFPPLEPFSWRGNQKYPE